MKEINKNRTSPGIAYIPCGDYYIPAITVSEEPRPVGYFGQMHKRYLEENHPIQFQRFVLHGELGTHLADVEEQARERLDRLTEQMAVAEGVTEELKARDPMEWVGRMNSIRNRAEEIVQQELIFR